MIRTVFHRRERIKGKLTESRSVLDCASPLALSTSGWAHLFFVAVIGGTLWDGPPQGDPEPPVRPPVADGPQEVAQVCNLPYRRFARGNAWNARTRPGNPVAGAGCKPAIRQVANLRYIRAAPPSRPQPGATTARRCAPSGWIFQGLGHTFVGRQLQPKRQRTAAVQDASRLRMRPDNSKATVSLGRAGHPFSHQRRSVRISG